MALVQSLYFIALLPNQQLAERITSIKNSFARNYNCLDALKTLPHITLQRPFKRGPESEVEIHLRLQEFFEQQEPLTIALNGFGCFDHSSNKVIYINVEPQEKLIATHHKLMDFLQTELRFTSRETSSAYHPHITIGYRDLTDDNFKKAWSIYKANSFSASFKADSVYLFKHDYRKWQVLSRFQFKK